MMEKNTESQDIDQLLAEADELIRQIHSDAAKYMKEEHRLQVATYTKYLQEIKSKARDENGEEGIGSGAEGMHKAVQDIVTAMRDLRNKLLSFPSNAFESPLKKGPSRD